MKQTPKTTVHLQVNCGVIEQHWNHTFRTHLQIKEQKWTEEHKISFFHFEYEKEF